VIGVSVGVMKSTDLSCHLNATSNPNHGGVHVAALLHFLLLK